MYRKLFGIVVFAFSLAFGQAVFADCGEGLKAIVEGLKIDEAQKAKIKPILEQLKSETKNNWTQMKDINTQLRQQIQSSTMDQNTVNDLVDKKTKLIGDMIKAKVSAKNQIYNILNDKQKTELQTLMTKMEEKMAEKYKKCHDEE